MNRIFQSPFLSDLRSLGWLGFKLLILLFGMGSGTAAFVYQNF
jgi:hypothetical protein